MYGDVAALQVRCFSAPLQHTEISGVKRVVQEKLPEGVNDNGLTLTGFLFLHALFIEKGRLETTWTVLRKFGYDNDIKLRDDLIAMPIKRAPDQVMFHMLYDLYQYLSMSIYLNLSVSLSLIYPSSCTSLEPRDWQRRYSVYVFMTSIDVLLLNVKAFYFELICCSSIICVCSSHTWILLLRASILLLLLWLCFGNFHYWLHAGIFLS